MEGIQKILINHISYGRAKSIRLSFYNVGITIGHGRDFLMAPYNFDYDSKRCQELSIPN